MEKEKRTICFDKDLNIEAYHFEGIMQPFPNHFHTYYVFGFLDGGRRLLTCKNREYIINAGDLLLFNPHDSHACRQIDDQALDWRCLNIEKEVLGRVTKEITGSEALPVFTENVICQSAVVSTLKDVHDMIINGIKDFYKEEQFYFLIEQLLCEYTTLRNEANTNISGDIQAVCNYMESNYTEAITLTDLSEVSNLNKYTLLRKFSRQKGITPYQYLSTIRIDRAKQLLRNGISPIDSSLECGFSDQSHFTRFFKNFIGLTPKQYQDIFSKEIASE